MSFWRKVGPAPLSVRSAARSHVGRVRAINEDRVFDGPEAGLWAVADGMGGHAGGDLAAQAVVDALRALAERGPAIGRGALPDVLRTANAQIFDDNARRSTDAGSTVVAAHILDRSVSIAWVGDCRAYLCRDGAARQVSHDHSVVQELIDARLLTAAAAIDHPRANVVTRALGIAPGVDVASVEIALRRGDRLLLCSDGLSRSFRANALCADDGPAAVADALLHDALERDGSDNISLVCIAID